MPRGTVKWFDKKKRYGFIESEDGDDFFVHSSSVGEESSSVLLKGEKVTFDIGQGRKGPMAIRVQVEGEKRGMEKQNSLIKNIAKLNLLLL
jgi:CspA family cold shock protein